MTLEGQKKKHSTGGRVIRNSDRVLKEVEIILIFFYFFYSSHSINPLLTISIAAWEWSPVCWPKPQGTYCTVPYFARPGLLTLSEDCEPMSNLSISHSVWWLSYIHSEKLTVYISQDGASRSNPHTAVSSLWILMADWWIHRRSPHGWYGSVGWGWTL